MSIAKIYGMGRYSQDCEREYRKMLKEFHIAIRRKNSGKAKKYHATKEGRKPIQNIPHEMEAGYNHPEYKH